VAAAGCPHPGAASRPVVNALPATGPHRSIRANPPPDRWTAPRRRGGASLRRCARRPAARSKLPPSITGKQANAPDRCSDSTMHPPARPSRGRRTPIATALTCPRAWTGLAPVRRRCATTFPARSRHRKQAVVVPPAPGYDLEITSIRAESLVGESLQWAVVVIQHDHRRLLRRLGVGQVQHGRSHGPSAGLEEGGCAAPMPALRARYERRPQPSPFLGGAVYSSARCPGRPGC